MNDGADKIAAEAIDGATKGGLLASAASITSGIAVASTPVKLLGLITLGTTTAISWPVVAALGVVGAIVGGASAAMIESKRQDQIRKEFAKLMKKP